MGDFSAESGGKPSSKVVPIFQNRKAICIGQPFRMGCLFIFKIKAAC